MRASIASAELAVDIDIYSDEEVPRALGITDEPAAVIAEPRGYIGEESVDSFYELIGEEETTQHIRNLINEFYTQAAATDVKAATYAGVRQYALSDFVAWVKASRNYALDLRNAIPLYYNPWRRHLARDMYALAPERYKRLAGPAGMRIAVKRIDDAALEFLQRYYETSLHRKRLMLLYPRRRSPPTQAHEEAVGALAGALESAFVNASNNAVKEALEQRRPLEWMDYLTSSPPFGRFIGSPHRLGVSSVIWGAVGAGRAPPILRAFKRMLMTAITSLSPSKPHLGQRM